jgi:hypothetical protein
VSVGLAPIGAGASAWRTRQLAVPGAVVAALVVPPLAGWPAGVRVGPVLCAGLALALAAEQPWRWPARRLDAFERWQPSAWVLIAFTLAGALTLYWIVLTAFRSGTINAVDFTVYFDRPSFQTAEGRPMFVEVADVPSYSYRSELAVHGYWAMVPIGYLYAIAATPHYLLGLSALSAAAGARHLFRVMQSIGMGGVLTGATALAFMLNDNTARALNYGFHPEVLYAWFVPWMLDAGLSRRRWSFAAAAIACLLVKEDACMPLFAVSIALALWRCGTTWSDMNWKDRTLFFLMPTLCGLGALALFYGYVVPRLTPDGRPTYWSFWANYGATPAAALAGMILHPWRVIADTATSGLVRRVLPPHLLLPFIGWRWAAGIAPIVCAYGASANAQLRAFGLYYAVVLEPFLCVAASCGAVSVARRVERTGHRAELTAAAAVLLGALLVGGGYSLRPWRAEVAAMPDAMRQLQNEPIVLVQSGLYPHAGYEARVRLLTPETLHDAAGAVALLAPALSAYPLAPGDLQRLTTGEAREVGEGLMAVRLANGPAR